MQNTNKKGFTLIELLIVIGILAVLAGIVVVALNPAELLRQARDSKRMGDLRGLSSALVLYQTDVAVPTAFCTSTKYYSMANAAGNNIPFAGYTASTTSASTANLTNGNGWIPINFGSVSGGSLLAALPLDPTNSVIYNYAYICTTTDLADTGPLSSFKFATRLESIKYRGGMTTDGGTRNTCTTHLESTCFYEAGSNLASWL